MVNEVNAVLREGDYACPESSLMTHHTSTMRMILICNKNAIGCVHGAINRTNAMLWSLKWLFDLNQGR